MKFWGYVWTIQTIHLIYINVFLDLCVLYVYENLLYLLKELFYSATSGGPDSFPWYLLDFKMMLLCNGVKIMELLYLDCIKCQFFYKFSIFFNNF